MNSHPRTLAVSNHCPKSLQPEENGWSLQDFVIVKKLGQGGASAVHQAIHRRSQTCVALKLYFKSKMTALNTHQVHREVGIHSRLNHPNIIALYGAFEDESYVVLVIEYAAKGDLFDLLKNMGGRMKESDVVTRVMVPFMLGLAYLHSLGVIHRDIKLENTLFSSDGTLKIADFGLSVDATAESPVTRLGTLDYMSPEVMVCPDKRHPGENKDVKSLKYSSRVDAWACGVLACELLVGCPPFGMSTREASVRAVLYSEPKIPQWVAAAAADFIQWALTKKPSHRPSVKQLLQHSWILVHIRNDLRLKAAVAAVVKSNKTSNSLYAAPSTVGLHSAEGVHYSVATGSLNSCNSTSSAFQAALADPLSKSIFQRNAEGSAMPRSLNPAQSPRFHPSNQAQHLLKQTVQRHHNAINLQHHPASSLNHAPVDRAANMNASKPCHSSLDFKYNNSTTRSTIGGFNLPSLNLQLNSCSTLSNDPVSSRSADHWGQIGTPGGGYSYSVAATTLPGSACSSIIAGSHRSPPDPAGLAGMPSTSRSAWSALPQQTPAYTSFLSSSSLLQANQLSSPQVPFSDTAGLYVASEYTTAPSTDAAPLNYNAHRPGAKPHAREVVGNASAATAAWVASTPDRLPPVASSLGATEHLHAENHLLHGHYRLHSPHAYSEQSPRCPSSLRSPGRDGRVAVYHKPEELNLGSIVPSQSILNCPATTSSDFGMDSPSTQVSLHGVEAHGSGLGAQCHSASPDLSAQCVHTSSGPWEGRNDDSVASGYTSRVGLRSGVACSHTGSRRTEDERAGLRRESQMLCDEFEPLVPVGACLHMQNLPSVAEGMDCCNSRFQGGTSGHEGLQRSMHIANRGWTQKYSRHNVVEDKAHMYAEGHHQMHVELEG